MIIRTLCLLLLAINSSTIIAQKIDYSGVTLNHLLDATLPQYADYKTYDLQVITTKEEQDKLGTGFNLSYQLNIGKLQQVENNGDFHIIILLQKYSGKLTSNSSLTLNVAATNTVYNKFGQLVNSNSINNEAYIINLDKSLTDAEMKNQDLVRRVTMEKLIEKTCKQLVDGLYGGKLTQKIYLASIEKAKKLPELQAFEEQVKPLKNAIETSGLEGYKTAATPFVSYWEKMTNYSGEGDAEDVKRAAYHNLSLFHIASKNYDKAREYIDLYKPIDKTIKELMGLVKYKNSELLEELITAINVDIATTTPIGTIVTKEDVLDKYKYLTVNGSVTISTRKEAGTYMGSIKINKIPTNSFGNIMSLDPENINATIQTKDEKGQPKIINTTISKIDALKDNDGTMYVSQKFGNSLLGGASYVFMKSTYNSPKVTVYKAILPESGSEYVIKKAGDDKGVKSSLLNAWKNLMEYLNDCSSLTEQVKNGTIDKKMPIEKIAEVYTDCK